MKRLLVYIGCLLCIASFVGCSDVSPVSDDSDRRAIVFENVQTKTLITSADELLGMGVIAQMNLGDEDKQEEGSNEYAILLENEFVSRTSQSEPWTYENTRYWVTDRVYHFFAVWPYSGEDESPVTNVSSVAGDGPYAYSVTFDTPLTADQELLTAKATAKTKTGIQFPESVGFNFQHELSNIHLKIWSNGAPDNVQDKIRVKQVIISNITKKGTLNATLSSSSWSYSSNKMSITKEYDGEGIAVSQAQIIEDKLVPNEVSQYNPDNDNPGIPFGDEGLLLLPHTITNSNPVVVKVIYDLQRPIDQEGDVWEQKTLQALLPEGTWPAGKKVTYNMILSGERTITEFQINTVVEDWYRHTDEIDFTQQVEVREGEEMKWVKDTYESINPDTGEVVLFTDIDMVATCEFNIRTPIGATWTASLIPLTASAMDAFSIVEDSKYGDVGTNETQRVKIKINNPDPISAKNACLLRITVQTSDGRTIVVKNLMPSEIASNIEEYTIVQNLING